MMTLGFPNICRFLSRSSWNDNSKACASNLGLVWWSLNYLLFVRDEKLWFRKAKHCQQKMEQTFSWSIRSCSRSWYRMMTLSDLLRNWMVLPACFINHTPADGIIFFLCHESSFYSSSFKHELLFRFTGKHVRENFIGNWIASRYLGKIVQFLRVIRQSNFRQG